MKERAFAARTARTTAAVSLAGLLASLAIVAGPVPAGAQTPLPPVVVEGASIAVRPAHRVSSQAGGVDAAPGTPAFGPGEGASARTLDFGGELASSIGTATSIVSGDDLQTRQVRTPAEAIRGLPGVVVSRTGSDAGLTQVRIRGSEGNHTLVMIDGIEANSPADGEFDFSNLAFGEEIERIEVLRGPQSGLYGSGAIGGVVNIVTRPAQGPLRVTARAETGSFSTTSYGATASGGNDRAWGLASVQGRRTGGFNIAPEGSEKDSNQITSAHLKAGFSPLPGLTIEGTLRQTNKRGQRDEENYFLPGVLIQQIDAPSRFSADMWLGALEAKLSLAGGAWLQSVRMENRTLTQDDFSANPAFAPFALYDRYRSTSELYRYTSTFRIDTPTVPGVRHFLTGLVESRRDGFVLFTDDNVDHERTTRSYAGELKGEYGGLLDLATSVRHDDSDTYKDVTNWRTAGSVKIPTTPLRLHASYGTGSKQPSLFEQYGRIPNFFTANPNLKPESARGLDAGAELTLFGGRAVVDATWFNTELKDKIQRVGGGTTVDNIDGISTRQGLEFAAKVIPLPGLVVSGSYTIMEASEPSGIAELRRPEHTGRVDVDYTFMGGRARVGASAVYNGSQIDEALRSANPFIFPLTPERVTLSDYWLVSVRAAYQLTPQVQVFGRIENALDQRYQEIYGFETAGIAAYAGVKISLAP